MSRRVYAIRKRCTCPTAKQSKCPHSYYFFYGRLHRFSIDDRQGEHIDTLAEATALGDVWREQIDAGTFRPHAAATHRPTAVGLTLRAFTERYVTEYSMSNCGGRPLKDRQHRDYYVFQPLLAFEYEGLPLGDRPLVAITEQMLAAFIDARRAQGLAVSTVNKDITLIKSACSWGAFEGLFGPNNRTPITGRSKSLKQKKHAERKRRVTDKMLVEMYKHSDPMLAAYIELALITCMRLTELYQVRWSDLQGDQINIRPDATKVETAARKAPLDMRAIEILTWLRIDPDGEPYPDKDFIFGVCGEPPVSINDRFNTMLLNAFPGDVTIERWENGVHSAAARARLEEIDILFSDIRHEGAIRKYDGGWLINELQQLLGHTNVKQTSTYLGVGDEETRRAMQRHGSGAKVATASAADQPTTTRDYHTLPHGGQKPGPRRWYKQQVTH